LPAVRQQLVGQQNRDEKQKKPMELNSTLNSLQAGFLV